MSKSSLITLIGPLSCMIYDHMAGKLSKPLVVKIDTQAIVRRQKSTYKVTNNNNISLIVENIVHDMQEAIESVNYPILHQLIFVDAADATCSSILAILLPIIKALSPYMSIHVVNLTIGNIFGLYAAHVVYSLWSCSVFADSFTLRDIQSSSHMISPPPITTEPGKGTDLEVYFGVSLDEMLQATALDMLVLQYILSQFDVNIHIQTISRCKLFDIRSSYWKYLIAYKKKSSRSASSSSSSSTTIVDYNALRSLFNNIRSAHLRDFSDTETFSNKIENSLFYSIEGMGDKLGNIRAPSFSSRDIEVGLDWASPAYTWILPSIYNPMENQSDSDHKVDGEIAVCLYDATHSKNEIRKLIDQCKALIQAKAYIAKTDYLNEEGLQDICDHLLDIME